jgi:hypothetical protein
MSTLIVDREPSVKDRLISLLNALEYGLYPPDGCKACAAALADRCGEHTQDLADMETASKAVALVQGADGDDEARRVFTAVIAGLAEQGRYAVASGVIVKTGESA